MTAYVMNGTQLESTLIGGSGSDSLTSSSFSFGAGEMILAIQASGSPGLTSDVALDATCSSANVPAFTAIHCHYGEVCVTVNYAVATAPDTATVTFNPAIGTYTIGTILVYPVLLLVGGWNGGTVTSASSGATNTPVSVTIDAVPGDLVLATGISMQGQLSYTGTNYGSESSALGADQSNLILFSPLVVGGPTTATISPAADAPSLALLTVVIPGQQDLDGECDVSIASTVNVLSGGRLSMGGNSTVRYSTESDISGIRFPLAGTCTIGFDLREVRPVHLGGYCQITTWFGQRPVIWMSGTADLRVAETSSPLYGVPVDLAGSTTIRFGGQELIGATVGFLPVE